MRANRRRAYRLLYYNATHELFAYHSRDNLHKFINCMLGMAKKAVLLQISWAVSCSLNLDLESSKL